MTALICINKHVHLHLEDVNRWLVGCFICTGDVVTLSGL